MANLIILKNLFIGSRWLLIGWKTKISDKSKWLMYTVNDWPSKALIRYEDFFTLSMIIIVYLFIVFIEYILGFKY
jgi:hypothetical protein